MAQNMKAESAGAFAADDVRKAVEALAAARPAYGAMIDFTGRIFAAQEGARPEVVLGPLPLAENKLATRRGARMPLVAPGEMRFDPARSTRLFDRICRIAVECGSELSAAAAALSAGRLDVAGLLGDFLGEKEARLAAAAAGASAAPEALSFFLYHSLRPSLCRGAELLSAFLAAPESWGQGCCPVCGSPPALAGLEDEGRRALHCGFCWHRWPLPRGLCPFCGARDPQGLYYLYSEEEPEYRLDTCSACRKYIKTVDTRALGRRCYPPLEQIASLHLDIQAAEQGFAPGLRP